jgi:hypothetical protein
MSLKNPVTPPGIDPGTVRLVAQRLNHYATPHPDGGMYIREIITIGPGREALVVFKMHSHAVSMEIKHQK